MPVLSYFVTVGLALLGLLYVADAVLPHDTRLQVRSNFDGIPPAPPHQYTRSALVSPVSSEHHTSSPEPALPVELDEVQALHASEFSMSATNVSAVAPQIGDSRYVELHNIVASQAPVLAQEVAVVAYADATHVNNQGAINVAEPSASQGVKSDMLPAAAASVSPAKKSGHKVKSVSPRLAKRQLYKNRKHPAPKREEWETDFAPAHSRIMEWSWHENERSLAMERRWHAERLRGRAWRDLDWRSESPLHEPNSSNPSWR